MSYVTSDTLPREANEPATTETDTSPLNWVEERDVADAFATRLENVGRRLRIILLEGL